MTRWDDVRRTCVAGVACMIATLTLCAFTRDRLWLVDAWLSIAVVLAPVLLLRLRRRPGAFDVWLGIPALAVWLVARFAPQHAVLGLLPGPGTAGDVHRLLLDLRHTTNLSVPPITTTPGVRLVICALTGMLAALIDLIVVVGRRGAVGGIPLLVMYTVAGAVARHSVAWPWFLAAAAAFVMLLALDGHGRPQRADAHGSGHRLPRRRGRALSATITTVTAAAAGVLALAVPALVPLPGHNALSHLFGHHGGGVGFGAGSNGSSIAPFASLRGQLEQSGDQPLLDVTVTPTTRGQSVAPFYLRTNVLGQYTPQGWTVDSHGTLETLNSSGLRVIPSDDPPTVGFRASFTVRGLRSNPPILAELTSVDDVPAGTRWSPLDQLLVGPALSSGARFREVAEQPNPTPAQLNQAGEAAPLLGQWLTHPALPSSVTSLVAQLTATARGPYARARAIDEYFTDPANGFTYSLSTEGDSSDELVDFLQNKQGYCQQYAAAMAIMLRVAGVPSRVVLGYMHAPPDASGSFTVTSHDAHAWVEAYFSGLGWIPFDPTPVAGLVGGAGSDLAWAPHQYPSANASPSAVPSTRASGPTTPATGRPDAQPTVHPTVAPTATASPSTGGRDWWPLLWPLLGLAVLAGLLTPMPAARALRRRRRRAAARRGDPTALWDELADTATDLGFVWSPARTPRQLTEALASTSPDSAAGLRALAGTVERARYGRPGTESPFDLAEQDRAVREVAQSLRLRLSSRSRLRARLWPASIRRRH